MAYFRNQQEWVNLIQKTIVPVTVDKNSLEEKEWHSESTKESEMQYLSEISKTTE